MESITIPEIYCPFPSQINPRLEQAKRHTLEWAKNLRLMRKETTLRYYLAIDSTQCVCRIHPFIGPEELFLINDWYLWAFLYDDPFDDSDLGRQVKSMRAIHDHLLTLLHNPPQTAPEEPIAEALYDIQQRVSRMSSSTWQRRFARSHADFFTAQLWEAEHRINQCMPDMQAYIANRCTSVFIFPAYDLLEFARHIELPAEIYTSQPFRDILQATCHIVSWTNDVYSFQKELAHGEVNNLVIILQHEQNCSFQEAVNQVCILIEKETRRFQEMVQSFPVYPSQVNQDMHNYLGDLSIMIRGLLDWQRETVRYMMEHPKPDKTGSHLEEIETIQKHSL